jgi:hypothetical protein
VAGIERTVDFLPLSGGRQRQEDDDMFSVHCPTHGTEVLLSERRIEAIEPTQSGHLLPWRCWCDTVGTTFVPRATAEQMVGRHRTAV